MTEVMTAIVNEDGGTAAITFRDDDTGEKTEIAGLNYRELDRLIGKAQNCRNLIAKLNDERVLEENYRAQKEQAAEIVQKHRRMVEEDNDPVGV